MRSLAGLVAVALVLAACGDGARLRNTGEPDASESPARDGGSAPADPNDPAPDPQPPAPDTRQGAPYPIVLVHGFGVGAQVGPLDYWWKIPDVLRREGERVFVMDNDPMRAPTERVVALAAFVDDVLAKTNARKVNLVGHSMGGIDSRLLVSARGYGDRVASITTIATPHRGSPVADAILGIIPGVARPTVEGLVNTVGLLMDGDEQDVMSAAVALTTTSMEVFNREHPDDPRVAYFSIVGETSADPLFLLHGKDFCDAGLWPTYAFMELRGEASDGLVPVESQKWGEVLRTIPADHYNEVAQPLGVVAAAFDWKKTYKDLARTLHARGF